MIVRRIIFLLLVVAILPRPAKAQAMSRLGDSSTAAITTLLLDPAYVRPTEKARLRNYFFDAYGPYPLVGAAIAAGISQVDNTPPEWNQGVAGYSERFVSDLGIAAVTITTRYALASSLHEDTLYYLSQCKGVLQRFSHAVISSFTGRRGDDGHRAFSFPDLIAPYAGTMTAVHAWYPGRSGAKDAFRMGNYSLLGYVGRNVALEFLYSGPHSLRTRWHLNNSHGAPDPGTSP